LTGHLEAQRVVLRGADILLETDSQGHGNWIFGADDHGPTSGTALPAIHELSVDDSTVTYRDGATGHRDSVTLQHLPAHDARSSSLVDVDLDARANDQPVRLAGTVGAFDALSGGAPFPIDLHGEVAGLAVTARGDIGGPLQGHGYSLDVSA